MVRVRQIVIDGLWHTDDAQFVTTRDGLLVNLVSRVLGIVAARVEKITNVVGRKHLKQSIHVEGGSFRLLLEIQFVSAGSKPGGGRMVNSFKCWGLLPVQVHQVLLSKAPNCN